MCVIIIKVVNFAMWSFYNTIHINYSNHLKIGTNTKIFADLVSWYKMRYGTVVDQVLILTKTYEMFLFQITSLFTHVENA